MVQIHRGGIGHLQHAGQGAGTQDAVGRGRAALQRVGQGLAEVQRLGHHPLARREGRVQVKYKVAARGLHLVVQLDGKAEADHPPL